MSGAAKDSALDAPKRKDMSGAAEARRFSVRIEQEFNRAASFVSRNAGCGIERVNRHGERGFMIVGIVDDHLIDVELVEAFAVDRSADQTLRISCHEIYIGRGDGFGGADQIAFVLAIFVVDDHNHLAVSDIFDCLFDCCKFTHRITSSIAVYNLINAKSMPEKKSAPARKPLIFNSIRMLF